MRAVAHATAPVSHLTATLAAICLVACTGRGATATPQLRDTGNAFISWTLQLPDSMHISATSGTLKSGTTATLTATTTRRAT